MFYKIKDYKIHYEIYGTGFPLVMLHGSGESSTIFKESVDILKKYFKVILIDTYGHGLSTKGIEDFHYESFKNDLQEIVTFLKLDKFNLFGFSDGAITALLYAYSNPTKVNYLMLAGLNSNPKGLKFKLRLDFLFHKSPLITLMKKEPNIKKEMLNSIKNKTLLTYGSNDLITKKDINFISSNINNSKLLISNGENHFSYVNNSVKIAYILLDYMEVKYEN